MFQNPNGNLACNRYSQCLKTTMKFKLIVILFYCLSFESLAQRCGGKFFFRIYDSNAKLVNPILSDTIRHLDNGIKKNKISGDFTIKNIDRKGNETSNVQLIRYSSTPLYLYFSTGCFTELKKISIKKDNEEMILNFCSIPREVDILFDSIKFIPGELTYNISQIIDSNKISYNIRTPENNSPWDYIIAYNLMQIDISPKSQEYALRYYEAKQEFKNDTLYCYTDSLKTKISSKGRVKFHLKKSKSHPEMGYDIVTYTKKGYWTYYFENSSLIKKGSSKRWKRNKKKNYCHYCKISEPHHRHTRDKEVPF